MSKIPNNFMPYRAKNVRRWNPDAGVLLHSDVGGLFVDINDYNKLEQCIARLEAENEQWKTWGIFEIAARNPNVSSYMDHWGTRALKAEAQVERLTAVPTSEEIPCGARISPKRFQDILAARKEGAS